MVAGITTRAELAMAEPRYEYRVVWKRAKETVPATEYCVAYQRGGRQKQKIFQTKLGAWPFWNCLEDDEEGTYGELESSHIERRVVGEWESFNE